MSEVASQLRLRPFRRAGASTAHACLTKDGIVLFLAATILRAIADSRVFARVYWVGEQVSEEEK